ncbi:helix-turn-helix transcriptional regulator [Gilliamella sp. ESL0250]|uniref:helix-turn-helix transcriptional regulator n=1 Tax=Gilliamella sp. ESL0250 TaxID=2705036 RepID=UPI0015808AAD|nr:excisionase family DNA-binding protein [Gilliamella sp. ESL0250]NUF49843.1 excisionase family DNA-binding protein [Gilliamella sp. ESL0250]
MSKILSSFTETPQTISIEQLATALGCNESTIYMWLKDETLQLPKPIEVGKKMCFIYEEIKEWLFNRPRLNCFYNKNLNKIEITNEESLNSPDIDSLINEQTALEILRQNKNKFLSKRNAIVMPCVVIDNNTHLFFSELLGKYILLQTYM